ncbi:MAG: hypothetical protein ABSD57_13885 [Verrucomicrobiota bacterium]|jgi:hypothetical protein
MLNSRFGLPEGLVRAFGRGKLAEISEIRVNFPLGKPRCFGHLKFFKKALARERAFDILCAPFRSEGRMVSMVAGR